jgi:hypothetical protein
MPVGGTAEALAQLTASTTAAPPRRETTTAAAEGFADFLLQELGLGVHISTVGRAARAAQSLVADGSPGILQELAALGSSGKQPSHEERDCHKKAKLWHTSQLELMHIEVEVQPPGAERPSRALVPALAPHELFAALWEAGEHQRSLSLFGPAGREAIPEWWRQAQACPQYADHPAVAQPELLDTTIPMVVHHDGAEVFANVEYLTWAWGSLTASEGDVLDRLFPVMSLDTHMFRDLGKLNATVASFFAWSFEALLQGKWPEHGFQSDLVPGTLRFARRGQPLAEGWRGAIVGFEADAKARAMAHRFRRYYRCTFLCESCYAQQDHTKADKHMLCYDFSPTALWRETCMGHRDFVAQEPETALSPWFRVPGLRLEMVFRDLTHTVHLGIGRDVTASLVVHWWLTGQLVEWCAAHGHEGGVTADEALACLYRRFREWCRAEGLQGPSFNCFSRLSLGRESPSDYPTMTTKLKAAHMQIVIFYLAHVAEQMRPRDIECKVARICIWALAQFLHVLNVGDVWLTHAEAAAAAGAGRLHLETYGFLSARATARSCKRWRLRPKHHYFDHLCGDVQSCRLNPRILSCFCGESFLGKLKYISRATHRSKCAQRTLERYIVFAARRWERRVRE